VLTKVTLTNFQSHKHLELDLRKFTTLTGGSNGGKTAVLRAVIALVRNDSANDYVRYGQKYLTVKLEFEDGNIVEWIKGSGENKYNLTTPDGKTQLFDKVGAEAPDEVKEVLKLGPVAIKASDKEYVNFHSQLEAPFVISSTPGNVAKLFGELTSASSLYTAVNEGNKGVRATNALKSTRVEDIEKAKRALEDFHALDDQLGQLVIADEAILEAKKLEQGISEVNTLIDDIRELSRDHSVIHASMEKLSGVEEVSLDDLEAVESQITAISSAVERLSTISTLEKRGTDGIEYLKDALSQDISNLYHLESVVAGLDTSIKNYKKIDSGVDDLEGLISTTSADILSMMTQIDELLESVESCPQCGQDLSDGAREALLAGKDLHATH